MRTTAFADVAVIIIPLQFDKPMVAHRQHSTNTLKMVKIIPNSCLHRLLVFRVSGKTAQSHQKPHKITLITQIRGYPRLHAYLIRMPAPGPRLDFFRRLDGIDIQAIDKQWSMFLAIYVSTVLHYRLGKSHHCFYL